MTTPNKVSYEDRRNSQLLMGPGLPFATGASLFSAAEELTMMGCIFDLFVW
jgi:hypothetical protein